MEATAGRANNTGCTFRLPSADLVVGLVVLRKNGSQLLVAIQTRKIPPQQFETSNIEEGRKRPQAAQTAQVWE